MTRLLAFAFLAWAALIAVAAGFVGAALNCEGGEGCRPGPPPWFQPWEWGEYYASPESAYVGLAGLAAASVFIFQVRRRRPLVAAGALLVSLVLLSYPFFAGLTESGRGLLVFGPAPGIAALAALARTAART